MCIHTSDIRLPLLCEPSGFSVTPTPSPLLSKHTHAAADEIHSLSFHRILCKGSAILYPHNKGPKSWFSLLPTIKRRGKQKAGGMWWDRCVCVRGIGLLTVQIQGDFTRENKPKQLVRRRRRGDVSDFDDSLLSGIPDFSYFPCCYTKYQYQ